MAHYVSSRMIYKVNVIWYSVNTYLQQHGVDFMVNKELVNSVISVSHVSIRIIIIRISAIPMIQLK